MLKQKSCSKALAGRVVCVVIVVRSAVQEWFRSGAEWCMMRGEARTGPSTLFGFRLSLCA